MTSFQVPVLQAKQRMFFGNRTALIPVVLVNDCHTYIASYSNIGLVWFGLEKGITSMIIYVFGWGFSEDLPQLPWRFYIDKLK